MTANDQPHARPIRRAGPPDDPPPERGASPPASATRAAPPSRSFSARSRPLPRLTTGNPIVRATGSTGCLAIRRSTTARAPRSSSGPAPAPPPRPRHCLCKAPRGSARPPRAPACQPCLGMPGHAWTCLAPRRMSRSSATGRVVTGWESSPERTLWRASPTSRKRGRFHMARKRAVIC
jgi:hypothetical protein